MLQEATAAKDKQMVDLLIDHGAEIRVWDIWSIAKVQNNTLSPACYEAMNMLMTESLYKAIIAHPYIAAVTSVAASVMIIDANCAFQYSIKSVLPTRSSWK
jgi:hypothetical protein